MLAMVCRGYKNTLDVGNHIFKKLPEQTIFFIYKNAVFLQIWIFRESFVTIFAGLPICTDVTSPEYVYSCGF